jgi:LppX/LprAFG-like lipoprotein
MRGTVAAIAGFAIAVLVAACGQTPAGSPPAASVPASPSAAVSAGASGSTPPVASGGSSLDPDSGAALDAFRAFVQTGPPFRMRADMLLTIGSETLDMDITQDVAGGDAAGTIDIRAAGTSLRIEVVVLDGAGYARIANRDWQAIPADAGDANPMASLDVEGLQPVGRANVAGTLTHHLRTEDVSVFDTSTITGTSLADLRIDALAFDVYVTDDGVPLTALMEFSGSGLVTGERQPVKATVRYDFSRFGEPVTIVAPQLPPSPSTGG